MIEMSYNTLPWIEKYRPQSLDEIISQNNIVNTLRKFIDNKTLPHLLLYGPPGTGKTSAISACARDLYGKYYPFMVMELNASDDRGIEVVRTRIKQFVSAKNTFYGLNKNDRKDIFKLVILDETDAMTTDAQAILRKVVEKYTFGTRFCLICNYIQNINPALQSRCVRFRFSPLKPIFIKKRVIEIIKKENIIVTTNGLKTIMKRSHGDMRKVLNILQSTSMAHDVVNSNNVNNCIGYPLNKYMVKIIDSLIKDNFINSYNKLIKMKKLYGLVLNDIITEIHELIIDAILHDQKFKNLNQKKMMYILDKLRIIEYNNCTNSSEIIQVGALIGIFKLCRKK